MRQSLCEIIIFSLNINWKVVKRFNKYKEEIPFHF